MTSREAYEKYKGREVTWKGDTGVVCGYNKDNLSVIVAQTYSSTGYGWDEVTIGSDKICSHIDNPEGYFYIHVNDIEQCLMQVKPVMRYFICFYKSGVCSGNKGYISEKYPNHYALCSVIYEGLSEIYTGVTSMPCITGINEVSEEDYNEWIR